METLDILTPHTGSLLVHIEENQYVYKGCHYPSGGEVAMSGHLSMYTSMCRSSTLPEEGVRPSNGEQKGSKSALARIGNNDIPRSYHNLCCYAGIHYIHR